MLFTVSKLASSPELLPASLSLPSRSTAARLRVVSDFMYYLFRLDDISDGMVRRGAEGLADKVMNALWFPDRYMPTTPEEYAGAGVHPEEEISAAKLARE